MKQYLLALVLLTFSGALFSQSTFLEKSEFGIFLGTNVNQARYSLIDDLNVFSINDVTSERGYGFEMGIVHQYNFNEQLAIRPQSILVFGGNTLNYEYANDENVSKSLRLMSLQFPIHLVYMLPTEKIQPSFIFGGRYIYDLSADDEVSEPLLTDANDIGLDIGIGANIKLEFFTMRTEVTYSRGMRNLRTDLFTTHELVLSDLYQDMLSIRLLFTN